MTGVLRSILLSERRKGFFARTGYIKEIIPNFPIESARLVDKKEISYSKIIPSVRKRSRSLLMEEISIVKDNFNHNTIIILRTLRKMPNNLRAYAAPKHQR